MYARTATIVGLVILGFTARIVPVAGTREVCCPPGDIHLSAREMKARLRHTVPVLPPARGRDVRVKGIVVFVVRFNTRGEVECIRLVSGHPLLVTTAMESVKHWKFRAGVEATCGKLVLALSTLKPDMGLQVLETEPSPPRRSRNGASEAGP